MTIPQEISSKSAKLCQNALNYNLKAQKYVETDFKIIGKTTYENKR